MTEQFGPQPTKTYRLKRLASTTGKGFSKAGKGLATGVANARKNIKTGRINVARYQEQRLAQEEARVEQALARRERLARLNAKKAQLRGPIGKSKAARQERYSKGEEYNPFGGFSMDPGNRRNKPKPKDDYSYNPFK